MKDSNTKPWMDITNGYTRVGFVKAVHAGDSLFILVNEFKNMKPADLDTADIVKAYTAAKSTVNISLTYKVTNTRT